MKNIFASTKTILALTAFTLISISGLAQGTGEIRGRLIDSITDEAIPGATVTYTVSGALRGTVTDMDGYFKIKPLNPGFYDLNFSYVSYKQRKIEGVHVSSDKITDMRDVQLANGSIKVVIITAYPEPLVDFEDPTAVPLGFADIERSVFKNDAKGLITTMSSDIKTSPDGKKLYFRGERSEAVMYIVDGVKTRDGQLGIPGHAIGHLTVYTGGVPAKYGDFTGGVVVIETRSYQDVVNSRR
jgi:hypothetical protein